MDQIFIILQVLISNLFLTANVFLLSGVCFFFYSFDLCSKYNLIANVNGFFQIVDYRSAVFLSFARDKCLHLYQNCNIPKMLAMNPTIPNILVLYRTIFISEVSNSGKMLGNNKSHHANEPNARPHIK